MEWLMGKARGVSKNFLSSSSSSLNAMSPSSPTSSADEMGLIMSKLSMDKPDYTKSEYISQLLSLTHDLSLDKLVICPDYINYNEWIASHVIGLYENINNVYEAIYDLCNCPVQVINIQINCGDDKTKKIKQTPKLYLDNLLSHCYEIIESGKCFPKKYDDKFPVDFIDIVSQILKNLLQCLTHLYLAHYHDFLELEFVPHLNSIAKHFFLFCETHDFLDDKQFEPLRNLHCFYLQKSRESNSNLINETESNPAHTD